MSHSSVLLFGLVVVTPALALGANQNATGPAVQPTPTPSLADSFRAWQKGLSSKDKEERSATLRSMLVMTKKDVQSLFPKHAEQIWPYLNKMYNESIEDLEKFAGDFAAGGAIVEVVAEDIRPGLSATAATVVRAGIPIMEYHVHQEGGGIREGGPVVFVNGRWIWIVDLPDEVEDILQGKKPRTEE